MARRLIAVILQPYFSGALGDTFLESISIPPRVLAGDFGGWLRDAMQARGISTRMLALRTGLDHTTISRLMSDDRQPTLSTAIALLRILAVEPEKPATVVSFPGREWRPQATALR